MKILFIGGTGNISLACTYAALEKGYEVFHLNRGSRPGLASAGVTTLTADIRDPAQTARALKGLRFDSVVDWVAYLPQHIEQDIETFAAITDQFVFISSASGYKKPPDHWVVTESTPLDNPYWQYSRDKIACEKILQRSYRQKGFPGTIVRPSYTYGERWLPTSFGSRDYTVPTRILQGREIIIHGDGQSIWTVTHSRDFARGFTGILGNPLALGEAFHITSDEALTWDNIHRLLAQGLGVEPRIVHIPSDFIYSVCPERGAGLVGDKAYSTVFDNSKIKRFVPEFQAGIPFHEGIKMSLAWFDRHPQAKISDAQTEADIERILQAWKKKCG